MLHMLRQTVGGPATTPSDAETRPGRPAASAEKRLAALQGELEAYECKLDMMASAVAELEMELACKDEQIHCLKAVVAECPEELPRQLVATQEELGQLRAQLGKLQRQQQLRDQAAAVQVAALRAALANASAGKPQGAEPCSPSLASDGPPTPLSPGQATPPLQKACTSSSWDGVEEPLAPVQCCSPVAVRKGPRVSGAHSTGDDTGPPEPDSPRSDLSGPTCDGCVSKHTPGTADGAGISELAALSAPLACDNPLFRESSDSRRALASLEDSVLLRASSIASLDARNGVGAGAAAFGLAKAQLEIQLHHAQQRLAALQSSSAIGCNQAQAAQARLRVAVRCLESLHKLLKAVLEQAGGVVPVDSQQLRAHLSTAVQDLARLAKAQREVGSCLDMLRLLLHRMAGTDTEDSSGEGGAAVAGDGAAAAAAMDTLVACGHSSD